MTESTYEQRYCAVIDILGFRQLVGRLGAGDIPFLVLKTLLAKIHNPPQLQPGILSYAMNDFRVQSISDAVTISTKPTASGLLQIFQSLSELTADLLAEGYFIRGAVVKGSLYHDDKMVFGEALINAFGLEQEIVVFPRIIVASNILAESATDEHLGQFVYERVRQSEDGPWYVHSLRNLESFLRANRVVPAEGASDWQSLQLWTLVQKQIERRFIEAADVPRHFQKVQWFAKYWNEVTDSVECQIYLRIGGPGLPLPRLLTWDARISV